MYQDYKDLLSAFQSHGVKYLVVGGFAVIYHSQPRFTNDMDLFIKAVLAAAGLIALEAIVSRGARRRVPEGVLCKPLLKSKTNRTARPHGYSLTSQVA
jgi:hypothetical protein